MADDNFQNDFFGGVTAEKRIKKPPLMEQYSRRRILPHVRIPVEHIVMTAIGVLVLMIISFAVGVERGKRIAVVESGSVRKMVEPKSVGAGFAGEPRETVEPAPLRKTVTPAPEAVPVEEEEEIAPEPPASVYIVQLASFKSRYSASEEIDRLKREGVDARLKRTGAWYQVHAAGYQTIDEARKAKQQLRDRYPDCYIRKVR